MKSHITPHVTDDGDAAWGGGMSDSGGRLGDGSAGKGGQMAIFAILSGSHHLVSFSHYRGGSS